MVYDRVPGGFVTIEARVRDQLREIVDPCSAATGSNLNIVEMGLVKTVDVSAGNVFIQMRLTTPACHMFPYFYEEIDARVGGLPGVESVDLTVDNGLNWCSEMMSDEAAEKQKQLRRGFESHTR